MPDYRKELIQFVIAFSCGIFFITYFLKVPHMVTGKTKIVNEYYVKNFTKNVPLDLFFVACYLLLAHIAIKALKVRTVFGKIVVVGVITALLTAGFCYYFNSYKMSSNFFSKWFHTVGYSSVVYDVILLCFIYGIYLYLDKIV